jgi:hypothetical protein
MMEKCLAPKKLYAPLRKWISNQRRVPVPLLAKGERKGPLHQVWKVIENGSWEFEE